MKTARRCLFTILLLLAPSLAAAAPPRPVPELTLTSTDARQVAGRDLAAQGRWLLLYLTGDEQVDGALLCALQSFSKSPVAGRVVVVLPGRSVQELKDLLARHEKLAQLSWFVDSDRSAAAALQLAGYTSILGIDGHRIEWDVSGAGKEQDALCSLLTDWMR